MKLTVIHRRSPQGLHGRKYGMFSFFGCRERNPDDLKFSTALVIPAEKCYAMLYYAALSWRQSRPITPTIKPSAKACYLFD